MIYKRALSKEPYSNIYFLMVCGPCPFMYGLNT